MTVLISLSWFLTFLHFLSLSFSLKLLFRFLLLHLLLSQQQFLMLMQLILHELFSHPVVPFISSRHLHLLPSQPLRILFYILGRETNDDQLFQGRSKWNYFQTLISLKFLKLSNNLLIESKFIILDESLFYTWNCD